MDDGATSRADELVPLVWNLLAAARNRPPQVAGAANGEAGYHITHAGIDALLLARFLVDPAGGEGDA